VSKRISPCLQTAGRRADPKELLDNDCSTVPHSSVVGVFDSKSRCTRSTVRGFSSNRTEQRSYMHDRYGCDDCMGRHSAWYSTLSEFSDSVSRMREAHKNRNGYMQARCEMVFAQLVT
jgi:hypothetical protein